MKIYFPAWRFQRWPFELQSDQWFFGFFCLLLISLILQPTGITSHSNIYLDNKNSFAGEVILGNLTAIFNHLLQFATITKIFHNTTSKRYNIYERGSSEFNQQSSWLFLHGLGEIV